MKKIIIGVAMMAVTSGAMAGMPYDKKWHLGGGLVVGAVVDAATGNVKLGAASGCLLGLFKEVADKYGNYGGTAEISDFGWTCTGSVFGAITDHAIYFDTFHGIPMIGIVKSW